MTTAKILENLKPGQLPTSVEKKILHAGSTPFPTYVDGCNIVFHFEAKVKDGDEIVDNTRKMGKPMELLLGKQFKLEIWEAMLKTMTVGEVSRFVVPKMFVMSYPMVSKALRDSNRPKDHKVEHHCCGMMNQGCGYQDLDKLMEHPQDLEFTFEIVEVQNPGEFEKEAWQMTAEEKLDSVPSLREQGNALFQQGNTKGAAAKYHEAIARIEQLALREKPGGEESKELDTLKVPLLLNYALCLMKQEEYYEAIEHFSTVLKIEPDNVKGLFRRAKCHRSVGNDAEACADFAKAVELDDSLAEHVQNELKKLTIESKKKNEKDKEVYKKMFGP